VKNYYAYIRVSTTKQGEHGVSLVEQRGAIEAFAIRNHFAIGSWYEEQETAAKRGRPIFTRMLKLLRSGKAAGVIIHKIDRSARNLRDWTELAELVDSGIEVHFAHESVDLKSRGGRLSADIMAVVASDYIRNLREETIKGFYGRLKQGIMPMPAPLGYLDAGPGRTKIIDPLNGPLMQRAFELYATGRNSLTSLTEQMYAIGLRNRTGKRVHRNVLNRLLKNPFYAGLIYIQKTNQTFSGIHEPLITLTLFERVQNCFSGFPKKEHSHQLIFRRLLKCPHCNYSLIGEVQKGYVYYRCQTRGCVRTCLREEVIANRLLETLQLLQFSNDEEEYLDRRLPKIRKQWDLERDNVLAGLKTKLIQIDDRLNRITDLLVDGTIEKDSFEHRKKTLLEERLKINENISAITTGQWSVPERIEKFLELAKSAYLAYQTANKEERRELIETITSNRLVSEKSIEFTLRTPYREIAERFNSTTGGPTRDVPRTWERLFAHINQALQSSTVFNNELPKAA